ncbi:MAG TPA: hypothetical protein EYP10_12050 [Armatimonadetes bacterium]|nr:hypothetical protein [Armatimonadota bacterium]
MHLEHRKQRIIRLLQAIENEARHLGKMVEGDDFTGQLESVAQLMEHLETIRRLTLRTYAEMLIATATRTDQLEDLVEQLMNWLVRLKAM